MEEIPQVEKFPSAENSPKALEQFAAMCGEIDESNKVNQSQQSQGGSISQAQPGFNLDLQDLVDSPPKNREKTEGKWEIPESFVWKNREGLKIPPNNNNNNEEGGNGGFVEVNSGKKEGETPGKEGENEGAISPAEREKKEKLAEKIASEVQIWKDFSVNFGNFPYFLRWIFLYFLI